MCRRIYDDAPFKHFSNMIFSNILEQAQKSNLHLKFYTLLPIICYNDTKRIALMYMKHYICQLVKPTPSIC